MAINSNLNLFFYALLDGVVIGCVYALIGLGHTLIFGVMGLINMCSAEFYTLCPYISYILFRWWGVHPVLATILAIPVTFVFGMLTERLVIRPSFKWGRNYAIMGSFVLSLLMTNIFLAFFGPLLRKSYDPFFGMRIPIFGSHYSVPRLFAALVSLIGIGIIFFLIKKTIYGKAIQAVSQEKEGALLVGINLPFINLTGYGLGCLLAGIAGLVLTPVYILSPFAGLPLIGKANATITLGGIGNIGGSVVAGIILGIVESLGCIYLAPNYRDAYSFIVLIIVLIFRPRGLFGREQR